jgi:hypothetical protein
MAAELGAAVLSLTGRNFSGAGKIRADRRSGLIPFRREALDHPQRSSGLERVV